MQGMCVCVCVCACLISRLSSCVLICLLSLFRSLFRSFFLSLYTHTHSLRSAANRLCARRKKTVRDSQRQACARTDNSREKIDGGTHERAYRRHNRHTETQIDSELHAGTGPHTDTDPHPGTDTKSQTQTHSHRHTVTDRQTQ